LTIKEITYNSLKEWKDDQRLQRGWRDLTNEILPGEKYKVTWVNGSDDPGNLPISRRRLTETEFIDELAKSRNVEII